MNSDEIVDSLQSYGIVRTYQSDRKTWIAVAKLFMHGMTAEVKSDFGHPTMLAALQQLHERVMAVVVQAEGERCANTKRLERQQ